MGFFTDTTICIGCKACEVACKQWNDLPADGGEFRQGGSYDHTGELGADDLAPRALRRARRTGDLEQPRLPTAHGRAHRPRRRPRRLRLVGVHVRRLQALHERRLPGRLPDRRADPHGVRHRRPPARRLQRLRLLHPVVPVRRRSTATTTTAAPPSARSATTGSRTAWSPRARRRARPTRSSSARYDELRRRRRAARRRRCTSAASRAPTSTAPATAETSSPAGSARSSCSPSRPSATGCRPTPTRRSRRTSSRRRWPPSAPGCWRRRAWRPRSSRGEAARVSDERDMTPAPSARRRLAGLRRAHAASGVALHRGDWGDGALVVPLRATTRALRRAEPETVAEAAVRARTGPLGEVGPRDDEGAGVDVGGAALLLVRRDRGRLVVRRAGLRPRRRPPLARASRGSSRSARWPPRRRC